MTEFQVTEFTVTDGVGHLVIRNEPLNVLTKLVHTELADRCRAIAADRSVRAVVLSGYGERAFSAGADLKGFNNVAKTKANVAAVLHREAQVFDLVAALPQPTIAAVRGYVLGGGLELILSCDLRVAAGTARLGLPEIKHGFFPASGGLSRLPRIVGDSRAKRLAFTGEMISGVEALEIGLVDEVCPHEETMGRALGIAAELAARNPAAVQAIKRVIDNGRTATHAELVDDIVEHAAAMMADPG